MRQWWKDLAVATKLYVVFGVMACLILIEMMVLAFSMNSLSSLRAFVEGEAIWSKAQKNSIHSLNQYALTLDPKYYADFEKHLEITAGDHMARLELAKENPNIEIMKEGFLKGGNHPEDIDGLIQLLLRGQQITYIQRALEVWEKGDDLVQELRKAGSKLHSIIQQGGPSSSLRLQLVRIGQINTDLTDLEIRFSQLLGEASRWFESVLFYSLLAVVLTVECTGLLLTFSFSRNLGKTLRQISGAANQVTQGKFDFTLPVTSKDELGQLATAMNTMVAALQKTRSERELAETANQSKTLFLANVSHELRTPLGVILGYTELIRDSNLSEEDRRSYLHIIDQTGQNLARILNDILDLSKIEAGHFDMKPTDFIFCEMVQEIREMFELKARDRKTALHFHVQIPESLQIRTDRDRLRQMFVNLVSNALKFTEQGRIDVFVELVHSEVRIRVKDTGIGIAKEKQGQLFQQFSRIQSVGQKSVEGAGLGLPYHAVLRRNSAETSPFSRANLAWVRSLNSDFL